MLTDKTKEAFTEFLRIWIKDNIAWETEQVTEKDIEHFYSFPFSMQYGVMVDFFDENGIMIEVSGYYIGTKKRYDYTIRTSERYVGVEYQTRSKARKNAILKANNLFLEKIVINLN